MERGEGGRCVFQGGVGGGFGGLLLCRGEEGQSQSDTFR